MSNTPQCFDVPELTDQEHIALKALYAGEAQPDQQRLALRIITNKFSRAHDVLYVHGSDRDSAFLSGRGFVGQQVLKYLHLPVAKLPEQTEEK